MIAPTDAATTTSGSDTRPYQAKTPPSRTAVSPGTKTPSSIDASSAGSANTAARITDAGTRAKMANIRPHVQHGASRSRAKRGCAAVSRARPVRRRSGVAAHREVRLGREPRERLGDADRTGLQRGHLAGPEAGLVAAVGVGRQVGGHALMDHRLVRDLGHQILLVGER